MCLKPDIEKKVKLKQQINKLINAHKFSIIDYNINWLFHILAKIVSVYELSRKQEYIKKSIKNISCLTLRGKSS